jgi:enterochelin esterase family protein
MKFRVLISLFVLATAAIDATAQERLVPGKSTSGEVAPSSSRSYSIELRAGDYVRGSLAQRGQARLVIYLPDGEVLRTSPAPSGDGRREFVFAAETAGRYRLDVVPGAASAVQFDLLVSAVIPLSGRLRSEPSLESYPSSRIEALRRQVASGRTDTTAFWKEVALTGTPLIEPVGADGKYQMVTFLWRERFETRNVLVIGTFQGPAGDVDNVMRRLPHTDVWYLTLKLQNGARFTYQLSPNDPLALEGPRAEERAATAQADPLNPQRFNCPAGVSKFTCVSAVELPGAPPQPWITAKPDVPLGRVETTVFHSDVQKLDRPISIYTPAGYRPDGPPNSLVVLFDGQSYLSPALAATTTLDNLIGAAKIPTTVVALVGNVGSRRTIDLVPNPEFEAFVTSELMPWVRQRYNVTSDPARTVVGGFSLGGLTATFLGLRHSTIFGNVLAQSGSFWWAQDQKADDTVDATHESNWIAKQFSTTPKLPIRFYLDAGTFEAPKAPDIVRILVNARHLRDVLVAKGYDVTYQQFAGGHDPLSWRGTLADGLIALLGEKTSPSVATHP